MCTCFSRRGKRGNCQVGRASPRSSNTVGAVCFMSKAGRAKDWPVLRRPEWYGCVVPALGAPHRRFDSTEPLAGSRRFSLGLALFAVFRFVDESLLPIELLFSRREDELRTAIYTKDISVRTVLHKPSFTLSRFRRSKGAADVQ